MAGTPLTWDVPSNLTDPMKKWPSVQLNAWMAGWGTYTTGNSIIGAPSNMVRAADYYIPEYFPDQDRWVYHFDSGRRFTTWSGRAFAVRYPRIYGAAGVISSNSNMAVAYYDLEQDYSTPLPGLSGDEWGGYAALGVSSAGTLFKIGGQRGESSFSPDRLTSDSTANVRRLRSQGSAWSLIGAAPVSFAHAGYCQVDDDLYIIGGLYQTGSSDYGKCTNVYRFNMMSEEWTLFGTLPVELRGRIESVRNEVDGKIYSLGTSASNWCKFWRFDPSGQTLEVEMLPSLPYENSKPTQNFPSLTHDHHGNVYYVGGDAVPAPRLIRFNTDHVKSIVEQGRGHSAIIITAAGRGVPGRVHSMAGQTAQIVIGARSLQTHATTGHASLAFRAQGTSQMYTQIDWAVHGEVAKLALSFAISEPDTVYQIIGEISRYDFYLPLHLFASVDKIQVTDAAHLRLDRPDAPTVQYGAIDRDFIHPHFDRIRPAPLPPKTVSAGDIGIPMPFAFCTAVNYGMYHYGRNKRIRIRFTMLAAEGNGVTMPVYIDFDSKITGKVTRIGKAKLPVEIDMDPAAGSAGQDSEFFLDLDFTHNPTIDSNAYVVVAKPKPMQIKFKAKWESITEGAADLSVEFGISPQGRAPWLIRLDMKSKAELPIIADPTDLPIDFSMTAAYWLRGEFRQSVVFRMRADGIAQYNDAQRRVIRFRWINHSGYVQRVGEGQQDVIFTMEHHPTEIGDLIVSDPARLAMVWRQIEKDRSYIIWRQPPKCVKIDHWVTEPQWVNRDAMIEGI